MYECRILCAALCRIEEFIFFVVYRDHTRITYQVPVPDIWSKQQFAAGTPIELLYEYGDAVRIEPRPPSPNTCRFCARSSRTLFRPQASGDGTWMMGVLGESRASYRLSITSRAGRGRIKLRLTAAAVRGTRRQLLTMAHTSTASSPPRCRTESSWLRAGRVWACTRPLQSVHAAAELVCRGRVVVLVSLS